MTPARFRTTGIRLVAPTSASDLDLVRDLDGRAPSTLRPDDAHDRKGEPAATCSAPPSDSGLLADAKSMVVRAAWADFIRTAIRNQLAVHADTVEQIVARKMLVLGLEDITRARLEAAAAAGEQLHIQVLGLVTIAPDVPPELARATIGSLQVIMGKHDIDPTGCTSRASPQAARWRP